MAKTENFYLDTRGGALVLQQMAKEVVHSSALKIAQRAMSMSGSRSGHKAVLRVVGSVEPLQGKSQSERYTATIVAADNQTEIQMRKGNYIAKARSAGRV